MAQRRERLRAADKICLDMRYSQGRKWEYDRDLYQDFLLSARLWERRAEQIEDMPFVDEPRQVVFSPENFDVIVGIAGDVFGCVFMVEGLECSAIVDCGEDNFEIIESGIKAIERELVKMNLLVRGHHCLSWLHDSSDLITLRLSCYE
jgi:hypothetical protein